MRGENLVIGCGRQFRPTSRSSACALGSVSNRAEMEGRIHNVEERNRVIIQLEAERELRF